MSKKLLLEIAKEINDIGGDIYYVGGYVRDSFIKVENKDIDVEIHNISYQQLKDILSKFGTVEEVGASFGILMLKGIDIDFAMPREEVSVDNSHKGFEIIINPYIGTHSACKRRDFTMNGIIKNVVTGEILDYYNGVDDIKNKLIRHIDSNTFIEDPLRVLRACQFASRFKFKIADETISLCKSMDIANLPKKRIFDEFEKACTKGNVGIFLEELYRMNQLCSYFGDIELKSIRYIKNNWHKSYDVELALSIIEYLNKNSIIENFVEKKSLINKVKNTVCLLKQYINKDITLNDVILKSEDISLFIKLANFFDIKVEGYITTTIKNMENLITGKDLINVGLKPNKDFKNLIYLANIKQLEGFSKEKALQIVLNNLNK